MKIGIDCRFYGPRHTGIGRYVQNLVENLLEIDNENEYVLFGQRELESLIQKSKIKIQNDNSKFKIIETDIPHYSIEEQLRLPKILKKEKVDLMHFTHFNVPVFYRGKYVVTIHDLIKHVSRGMATTTKSPFLYWAKYLGYKFVFFRAVKKAKTIIVPSESVKKELVEIYCLEPEKVVVTYEGVETELKVKSEKLKVKEILEKYGIKKPYLLYVGSVYPHKNIERLIEAIKFLNQSPITNHQSPITLVVVCARNVFSERLSSKVVQMKAQELVNLVGFVPDNELSSFYQEAEAFVFPTLSEGFGLPGLEAMAAECPVICSDIPVLREIYKEAAVFFNPLDSSDIAKKINDFLLDRNLQMGLKKKGKELIKTYSWSKMAKETLKVYNSVDEGSLCL